LARSATRYGLRRGAQICATASWVMKCM
jgi:hypothetical protein